MKKIHFCLLIIFLLFTCGAYAEEAEIIEARTVKGKYGYEATVINFVPSELAGGWKYVDKKNITKRVKFFKDLDRKNPRLPARTLAAIYRTAFHNVFGGYKDDTFRPNNPITRAEFTSIAVRAFLTDYNSTLAEYLEDKPKSSFTDTGEHWAKYNIEIAVDRRWVNGYKDKTFRPENKITHAEAVTILNRIAQDFGREETRPLDRDEDKQYGYKFGIEHTVAIGEEARTGMISTEEKEATEYAGRFKDYWDWAYEAIRNFAMEGIIGKKFIVEREFFPSYNLTRAEAAVLIDAIMCHFEGQRLDRQK